MVEIRRILCPIDFSDFSRRALDHAMAIARWYGATITLLHVHAILPPPTYALGTDVLPSAGFIPVDREALVASMKRFAGNQVESSAPMEFDIAEGVNPATEILTKAIAMPADLVVLGTHGRSGFERLVLGSVTGVAQGYLPGALCAQGHSRARLRPAGPVQTYPVRG